MTEAGASCRDVLRENINQSGENAARMQIIPMTGLKRNDFRRLSLVIKREIDHVICYKVKDSRVYLVQRDLLGLDVLLGRNFRQSIPREAR